MTVISLAAPAKVTPWTGWIVFAITKTMVQVKAELPKNHRIVLTPMLRSFLISPREIAASLMLKPST